MEIKNLVVGPLLTNCYILSESEKYPQRHILISKKEAAVIDPGGGAKKILKEIENEETKLKYIILTHTHLDHSFATSEIKEKTGAEVLIHEAEKDLKNLADKFLKEGEEIKIGDIILKVIHTPGHTKGSICLLGLQPTRHPPASRAPNFIFTGDTLFKNGYGRTDLPSGSSKDLKESLQKLSKFLKPGMKIYPGHGEIFEYKI
ncbi:MBL fold metallo-hydrolase [Patescibacteria group bacterium]|nr:MBL fold metallo-hydrolase [Patescibacteria group bacterium]